MAVFAYLLAFLAAGMSALFFLRVRSPNSIMLWILKVLTGSVAAFVAVMGALGVAFGLLSKASLAIAAGVMGALLSVRYVLRVAARHDGFERAFGLDWQRQIAPEQQARMLKRRWVWQLPAAPVAPRCALGSRRFFLDDPRYRPRVALRHLAAAGGRESLWAGVHLLSWERLALDGQRL
jgi:hypothetical protein